MQQTVTVQRKKAEDKTPSVEGIFRHPVSKRTITGVMMVAGMIWTKGDVWKGKEDWVPCPAQLLGQKKGWTNGNGLWIRKVEPKKKRVKS